MRHKSVVQKPLPIAFDIPGAAQYLSTTPWGIRRLCHKGKLAYRRAGRRILIPREALDAFMRDVA